MGMRSRRALALQAFSTIPDQKWPMTHRVAPPMTHFCFPAELTHPASENDANRPYGITHAFGPASLIIRSSPFIEDCSDGGVRNYLPIFSGPQSQAQAVPRLRPRTSPPRSS